VIGQGGNDEQAAQLSGLFNMLALDREASNRIRRFRDEGDTEALEQAVVELDLPYYTATIYLFLCAERQELLRRGLCRGLPDRSPPESEAAVELLSAEQLRALIAAYKRQDVDEFQALLDAQGILDHCHELARWIGALECAVFVPQPKCEIGLAAIRFNHNPASLTNDALNIRIDYRQLARSPEWTQGLPDAAQSPAAYSVQDTAGRPITIKAKFVTPRPATRVAEVKTSGGGVLGALDPTTVNFTAGVSVPEFVDLPLNHHSIGSGGVYGVKFEDIEWQWMYRCPPEATWHQMDKTRHRIYVVRREPRGPWKQQPFPDDQNPWAKALDFACSITGGGWEPDPFDGIAAGIADRLNWGGVNANAARLAYDIVTTGSHYSSPTPGSLFDLTRVLDRLAGGIGNGEKVNCTDCACIMTTFANLLGCELWEGQIFTGEVNATIPIGLGQWWLPHQGFLASATDPGTDQLFYHEVAWKDDLVVGNRIYDICYLVNGQEDPNNPQRSHPTSRLMYYPYGVRFADQAAFDYREKLAAPLNVGNTIPDPTSKTRRPVV
jgi:hypothetical protein